MTISIPIPISISTFYAHFGSGLSGLGSIQKGNGALGCRVQLSELSDVSDKSDLSDRPDRFDRYNRL